VYYPAVAERLLSKENCARIIAGANEAGFHASGVQSGAQSGYHYNSDARICEQASLTPEAHRDLYEFVAHAVKEVNEKQYRFVLTGLEPLQVMRYSPGSFFREHSDLGFQPDGAAGRKISLIVQLNEGDEYSGGELVLFGEEVMPRSQGTVCMFPSWLPHRVDKLTAGIRHTLVGWAKGPPFN